MKTQSLWLSGLLSVLLIFGSTFVCAETSSGIIDIYQQALEKDALIAAERAATKAGAEKQKQGLAGLLPKIDASANASYSRNKTNYDDNTRFPDTSSSADSRGLDVKLIQPLFHLASYTAYSQSKIAVNQSRLQLHIAEQNLILRVAKAYFDILSANESLSVAKSQTAAFKENLDRAILTFKVGTATKTDKLEAQARYDLARAKQLSALNQLAIAKQSLASIIGETPPVLFPLNKNAPLLKVDPQNMQHWVDAAIANNLSLKLSKSRVTTSQLEIKRLKNDRLPVINFVADGNQNKRFASFANTNTTTTEMSVSLQLSLPIYTGGLMSSRIREAESLHTQQKYKHTDALRQVILQTQQAYLTALNGFQQLEALNQASISSASALQATRKGMEVGVRTNLDLLNSQQQFFETERDYTVAKYNYLLSVLDLKAAAGVLSRIDVEKLNHLLSPKK